jgi:predicted solute-binding protein
VSPVVRLGAVGYLNARPLVYGLDARSDLVSVRYDVPSVCAQLLESAEIDLGMVPSITYLDRHGDRIVPGVCIGSDGDVASVALFSRTPLRHIRHVALDTSSRTSAALAEILFARRFGVRPGFFPHAPDLSAMLAKADAALLIGDPALFADPRAYGADRIDLGREWTEMTGLPFVWAFWAGRPDAASPDVVALLQEAARQGIAHSDDVANAFLSPDPARQAVGRRYLREHLRFELDDRMVDGLRRFYQEAHALGLVPRDGPVEFYGEGALR